MNRETQMLLESLAACEQRIKKLRHLEQIERLNLLAKEADFVITAFEEIVDFLKCKGFILAGCD